MTKPTDAGIIARALALLASGLLVSNLPAGLMKEFRISPDRARKLARRALEQRREISSEREGQSRDHRDRN